MKRRKAIVIFGVTSFILLVAASIYAVLNYSEDQFRAQNIEVIKQSEGRDNHLAVGENLLESEYERVLNIDSDFEDLIQENEVTVVNFFASWCEPCKRETPDLNQYYMDHIDEDTIIIGVNIRDDDSDRDRFLDTYSVEYPIYEFSDEAAMMEKYKINVMPTTFFIDREGEIIRSYIGEVSPELLTTYIEYVKEAS